MVLQKSELLARLKAVLAKYTDVVAINAELDSFIPEDNYVRNVVVPEFPGGFNSERERRIWKEKLDHTYERAIELAGETYRQIHAPKKPEKPKKQEFMVVKDAELTEKQQKVRNSSFVAIGVCIFFLLGAVFGVDEKTADTLPTILGIAAVAAATFAFFKYKEKTIKATIEAKVTEAQVAFNRQQEKIMTEYNEKMKAYKSETEAHELALKAFLEQYTSWREVYLASQQEEKQIKNQLEKDRQAAVQKIYEEKMLPAMDALSTINDLVPETYLPVLHILIDLINSGRADDLKEAINLHEEILYRERQLALEQEKEAQRQYEERQRRQDEERRYREDMQFRKEQERQRQREEERRQQNAERRHREEMEQRDRQERDRQNEERRRADEERRRTERAESDRRQKEDRDTRDQCNRCAQVGHCSMAFRRPSCASFRPQ